MGAVITLTTDFGIKDPFVGQVKGVIKSINPEVDIIDLTHDISKHSIKEASIVIGLSYKYFPSKTIHIVVVDPTVGSNRRPIIVSTGEHIFVGPDNGIFSFIYHNEKNCRVFHISADHYFLKKDSTTFQARDIFAPVAAYISKGLPVERFGEPIYDYIKIPIPEPNMPMKNAIEGEIIYIDRFGNALTNISRQHLKPLLNSNKRLRIVYKGKDVPLKRHYSEAEDDELYAVIDSFDLLELYVYRGSAAEKFGIKIGDIVGVLLQNKMD